MILKRLNSIIEALEIKNIIGNPEIDILDIQLDSRKVEPGGMFIAVKGYVTDGHKFIPKAVENGAACIVCEQVPDEIQRGVCYVQVNNSKSVLGLICQVFFDHPSEAFHLIGVTGTNGKTTCTTLLYDCFRAMGETVGLISTVEVRIGEVIEEAERTTPDAIALNRILYRMKEAGCSMVFMEVSSHAIDQGRIDGLDFTVGVFTNISHDHLDYHKTFKAYIHAKKKFFDNLCPDAKALTNLDDSNGLVMLQNTQAERYTYGVLRLADFKGKVLSNSMQGLELDFNGTHFYARLTGDFNAYNLLAVYGVSQLLNYDSQEVLQTLSQLNPAEGRFDVIYNETTRKTAIVDYAHTPDALEKVLKAIQKAKEKDSKIIAVYGCGGNRDKGKRPLMASIGLQYSDVVIFTADNPRDERVEEILDDMIVGADNPLAKAKWFKQSDRAEAIKMAISFAEKGDVILVAGKGHEKYQEIKGVKYPFDDKEKIKAFMLKDT